ncbi:MAG: tetratricopeptide repeat protein [Sodaliphilus sp.]
MSYINRYLIALLIAFFVIDAAFAQKRTVEEVKKSISDLSADLKAYKSAQSKLKPALEHEATKSLSETWWVAAKVEFGIYDKNRINKSVGNSFDVKEMGIALINGYDYCQKALKLDTVPETNRDGSPRLDKATNLPKVKTKFSKEIWKKMMGYVIDYSAAGADLYLAKDMQNAYRLWDIYYRLTTTPQQVVKHKVDPDTVIGETRYFQAMAAMQIKKLTEAHSLFEHARKLGVTKKGAFDHDIRVLLQLGDTATMVEVAKKAYALYGQQDVQYMRIMINDCIHKGNMKEAEVMLDKAILMDSLNANYFTIKGQIVESQSSFIEAQPFYLRAVELAPEDYQTNFDVGRCYYLAALKYINDNPKKSSTKLLKELTPHLQKAQTYLEKAYEINHSSVDARSILRDIYYRLSDGEKLDILEHGS